MLSEDEIKAIKVLEQYKKGCIEEYKIEIDDIEENIDQQNASYLYQQIKATKIVLNIITKLQKENEEYRKENGLLKEKNKEIQKYKNMYLAEHDIHLVRNEQLERKERGLQSLQKQLLEKDKIIKTFENECKKFKVFCKRIRKNEKHDIDLFNQGQEQKCNQFLNLISGEPHWDYKGKYFDETDKQVQKLAKEKGEKRMKEIQIGEYCRTNDGIIGIKVEYDNGLKLKIGKDEYYKPLVDSIVKHSKNIIDLIEENDYVNGYKVVSIDKNAPENCIECIELDRNNAYEYQFISIKDIKTIWTKEQLKSIEYNI